MSKPTLPTAEQIERMTVASLSDKPNAASRYGVGGLTAKELKNKYDALPLAIYNIVKDLVEGLDSQDFVKWIITTNFHDIESGDNMTLDEALKQIVQQLSAKYVKPAGGIPTEDIATGAVTDDKIADGAVNTQKLADDVTELIENIAEREAGTVREDVLSYVDQNLTEIEEHITEGDADTLESAKNYADNKDVDTLESAKNYTDAKVAVEAADYRGAFANWASVPTSASGYQGTPNNRDIITVLDASDYGDGEYTGTWRFKYTGSWDDTDGKSRWSPEEQMGGSTPLTPEQAAALNSGITAAILSALQTGVANAFQKTGGNISGNVIATGLVVGGKIGASDGNVSIETDTGDEDNQPKFVVTDNRRDTRTKLVFPDGSRLNEMSHEYELSFPAKSGTLATTDDVGGASSWSELQNKPFNSIGQNLVVENGVLRVDTTNNAEENNTKPITSTGVYTIVGNINTLLSLI